MTTIHDVANEEPVWRKLATRPGAASTRSRLNDKNEVELPFPPASNDYNKSMSGADQASHLWSSYTVSRHRHLRNWLPFLQAFLDATIANIYCIYRLQGFGESLTHKELQEKIGWLLLSTPSAVLRQRRTSVMVQGQRSSKTTVATPPQHHWVRIERGFCDVCKPVASKRGRKTLQERALSSLSVNIRRRRGSETTWACTDCKTATGNPVPLCRTRDCWRKWHGTEPEEGNAGL